MCSVHAPFSYSPGSTISPDPTILPLDFFSPQAMFEGPYFFLSPPTGPIQGPFGKAPFLILDQRGSRLSKDILEHLAIGSHMFTPH